MLKQIITDFRHGQDRAVATIRDDLKWKLPLSNTDWALDCGSEGYSKVRDKCGIGIHTHGYGIELRYLDLTVDFDWGELGEGTGFDVWRLWSYCEINDRFVDACTHDSIKRWVEESFLVGELDKDESLYYLPHERSIDIENQNKQVHPIPHPLQSSASPFT